MSDVYFRIYLSDTNEYLPVCMQDFDECDYDQSRFLCEDKFKTEKEAIAYINTLALQSMRLIRSV